MISFKPLMKYLIDLGMTKEEFKRVTGISDTTMRNLNKNGNVGTNIINHICENLNCNVSDIMEFVENELQENKIEKMKFIKKSIGELEGLEDL